MKKLVLIMLLLVGGLFTAPTVSAQDYRRDNYRQDRRYVQREVRTEYRYVQMGRRVFKETYRSVYRNGRLVNRVLISRERVRNERDRGFRFNIYF